MLVSDVGKRVKRQFGDDVGAQIDDSDVLRWCNDAQKEIALQNKLMQTISSSSTVIDTYEYTLPTDLLALRAVRYNKVKLTMTTMDELDTIVKDRSSESGTPGYYYTFADTLTLWPVPDAVGTLEVYYTQVPTELTSDASSLTLPAQYDNRVVEYCVAQAAELDDNLEHYQLKMSQFQNGIDTAKQTIDQVDNDDLYPFITASQSDMGDVYYA